MGAGPGAAAASAPQQGEAAAPRLRELLDELLLHVLGADPRLLVPPG